MSIKSISWLSTLDLETFINKFADAKTKEAFLGVFPINHLPQRLPKSPVLFIINTNSSNLPGQHWKAVYISKNLNGEVLDSLATPTDLILEHWMNRFSRRWSVSTLTLQNPLSPTCGAYVLYFIMSRLNCTSLKSCMTPFTSNVIENDEFVAQFFNNQFQ